MKSTKVRCQDYYRTYLIVKSKMEIAEDYVKIYKNKRLTAKTNKKKDVFYRKQKIWENRYIRLRRQYKHLKDLVENCKKDGY